MGAQNRTHLEKLLIKTHPRSRPAKRLRLEGAEPLNLMMVTHFQLFFQGPRASERRSKWSQNGISANPKSQKIKKSGHSKKHGKTTLEKAGYWSKRDLKSDCPFRPGIVSKVTKIRDILKIGPRASKMSPRAPKTTQNHESDHPKSRKSYKKESRKS